MERAWQRLTLYLGLRDDPASGTPRSEVERPSLGRRVLEAAPVMAVTAIVYSLVELVRHLVFGGSTSAGRVALGALVFFLISLPALLICDGIARWWRESDDPPAP
jgi:hypothetical protein